MNNLRKLDSAMERFNTEFHKNFLGLDEFFNTVRNTATSYPPVNIIQNKHGDYRIEIAVPGWHKDDLKVTVADDELRVEGVKKQELSEGETFLHRGLSGKTFSRVWHLGPTVEVDDVELIEGLLKVYIKSLEVTPKSKEVKIR